MIKKAGFFIILLAVAIFLPQPNANAAAILTLSDGASTAVVSDTDADGLLTFNGGIGAWVVNITTGLTKPLLGTAELPSMHLNSVDVSSAAGGTLTIRFSDDGWTATDLPVSFNSQVGGVTGGSITAHSSIGSVDLFNGTFAGAFSDSSWTNAIISSTVPLVLEAVITHTGSSASSFDFAVSVPEASTLLMLATGLVGMIGYRRKRRMA